MIQSDGNCSIDLGSNMGEARVGHDVFQLDQSAVETTLACPRTRRRRWSKAAVDRKPALEKPLHQQSSPVLAEATASSTKQ
eukprot:7469414-Pyramimonas_sp.AAC.1